MNELGPVVAGKFYPGDKDELVRSIEDCYRGEYGPGELPEVSGNELRSPVGLISPHAGYPYSGPIAAHAFGWMARLGKPEAIVVLGTNHSGLGPPVSILTEGSWSTPLGNVDFDVELGREVLKSSELLEEDRASFNREHSIEVQLPFLQHLWGSDLAIVPVCLKDQSEAVADDIATALEENLPGGSLVIASTDFTHYETKEVAEKKDEMAIEAIMDRKEGEFYERVRDNNISICGYGTIGVLLNFSLKEDLRPTRLKYATSGEIAGYGREVVGYSAIGFRK
jgi:hypothetical protein